MKITLIRWVTPNGPIACGKCGLEASEEQWFTWEFEQLELTSNTKQGGCIISKFIYRCNKCNSHVTMIHPIGQIKKVVCPKCKVNMSIEIQPVSFRINGYNADNGYSGGDNDRSNS